ncbi:major facilitator superfamily transporter [Mariannaea sp. PMI_226]|nr:major facilitator superfamily transporter [Mariannaea sp. PMI_226]
MSTQLETTTWSPTRHQILIMVTLSLVSFMVALDSSIVVTSLGSMVTDVGGTATQGFWVGTSYLLANAVAMPLLAALSDIFGRPILLTISIIFFTVGSLVCCLTSDIHVLIGGRSIQGAGGGGIIVLSLVVFTDIVPLRFRPKWYGIVQGAWAIGNCFGPLIGGVIVEHTTWRWVFYIMFPFCAFSLVAVPVMLTLKPRTETIREKLARVDWVGSFLFTGSATAFLIAISWGGTQFSWSSVQTLVPLIVGIVGLIVTGVWEYYVPSEPLLQRGLLNSISSGAIYFCSFAQGLIIFGQLYYIPFYFLSVKLDSPQRTGIDVFPVTCTLVPGSIITGILVTRFNNYRYPIWIGWAVLTIGCGLTVTFNQYTPTSTWAVALVLLGIGHGSILNAQNFASQASCKSGDEAAAAAMYGFFRQLGCAIGVGIGGSTFQNIMQLKLQWEGLPKRLAYHAESLIPKVLSMPDGIEKTKILNSYTYGFRGVYLVFTCGAGVTFLISLLISRKEMNREIVTEHILKDNKIVESGISD